MRGCPQTSQPTSQSEPRGINIFPGLFSDGISSDDLGPLAHLIYASSAQPFPLPASIFSTEKFLKILLLSARLLRFSSSLSLFLFPSHLSLPRQCGSRLNYEEKGVQRAAFSTRKTPLYVPAALLSTVYNNKEPNKRQVPVGWITGPQAQRVL